MKRTKLAVGLFILYFLAVTLGVCGQDSISSASPDREPIWTARLLFIAVNDGTLQDAENMFTSESTVSYLGKQIHGEEIANWLQTEVFGENAHLNVQESSVEGDTVTTKLLWRTKTNPGQIVRFVFLQDENGLIKKLTIEKVRL